jgi:predicted double-glycine peptidase
VSDLQKLLKKGIPAIVDWFSTDEGHYSVAVGVDKSNIYLQDPELGRIRKMKREDFQRVWFDFPGDCIKSKKDLIVRRMIVIYK